MRIALIQQHASLEPEDNLERGIAAFEKAASNGADLVCYAELAFERFYPQFEAETGFESKAQTIPGPITDAFAERAGALGVVAVLNLFEHDDGRCYDTSPVVDGTGELLGITRMVHIPDLPCFHERGYYSPGDSGAPVYQTRVGTIGVAICYDRHYPEYMRALALAGAELVVVPQAGAVDEWPPAVYEAELQAACFQNGYFAALCNRVGEEEKLVFAGESFVCAPDGRVIARAPRGQDHILYADLDLAEVAGSSAQRFFLQDRRPELYGEWLR